MIKNHEEDEFIAVRVQDPRVQNEGSWNSYVDFKIFLHTNSKAFTAKTSCVRRRYSEFVWLKKKLQKNAGLVPVPDLPSKSFFSFSTEDFIEKRRKGLQCFLDKVLHMTVCLSDSQLHLFLQTQLPVGHIQDCVQGHTPYTVTEAILTYASSNRGWAQEEDVTQEPTLTPVPYESMESPAPHVPNLPSADPLNSVLLTSTDSESLHTMESIADIHDIDTVELQFNETENPFLVTPQEDNHGEAVLEMGSPVEATSVGDSLVESAPEMSSSEEETRQEDGQRQTPVEVHCPWGLEEEGVPAVERVREEEDPLDVAEETIPHTQMFPEPNSHKEMTVPDPMSRVEPTQDDNEETGSSEDVSEGSQRDDSQGHVNETERPAAINQEEEQNTETALEGENGNGATQEQGKTLGEEIEVADGERIESHDGETLPEGVRHQSEDLDGESNGETSSDGSSLEESATEDGGPEKTSRRVTNGYVETTPKERHQSADVKPKAGEDPSLGSAEANNDQEDVCVEVREDEEILYITNICPAENHLERMSSGSVEGVEEVNNLETQGNDLESSDDHCTDDSILLAVEPDAETPVKCHEREVREFTADANLTVSQETEP